ncbi:MAG TPA: flavodoxin [Chitinophagaceae bacterium]|nr:flavodoxin [Chitinophagaceae bacterium]
MKSTTSMTRMLSAFFILIPACSSFQTKDINAKVDSAIKPDKILIVYLSRTNNTKTIAEIIHKNVGGTLVALELEKPYPENYQATVQQVVKENETGYLPPLKTRIDSIQNYDVVFVGFPTWGMKLPPPMKSFLKQYDLSGKTIVPFNTNDGYGIGSSFDTVKELCPKSKILDGFSIKGGTESDGRARLTKVENAKDAETKVKKWLQEIKLSKEAR